MAISNVRFYRLDELPSFIVDKHIGIFVHVTKTMYKDGGLSTEHQNPKEPAKLWMTPGKDGGNVGRINFIQWLTERNIEEIASGLWFGGENGWELLSNDTSSGAITAAIEAKIATLDAGPYAQATITTTTDSSTLTIKGIKEVDGIIGIPVDTENRDLNIKIDGVYNESSNKIATQSTVTTAINGLDVDTAVQAVTIAPAEGNTANTVLTFNGIKEENGVIAQGASNGATTFTVGDAKLKIQIGSDEAGTYDVFSANAQSNGFIKLNENVFKKDENNVISVITKSAVASNNKLVTEQDIARLSSAMYYKGSIASDTQWPSNVKAGDVWIASGNFEHVDGSNVETIESGDLIVFNTDNVNSDYTVVQSNITLGIGDGQIAKNVGTLANGNLVVATATETGTGIKTIGITEDDFTSEDRNTRKLTYVNGAADTSDATLFHSTTITDTFKVINKDFNQSINISSTNRSIKIARNAGENDSTGVIVDLVWNTIMEP